MADMIISIKDQKTKTTFEDLNFADMFALGAALYIRETNSTAINIYNLETVPFRSDVVVRRVRELIAMVET